MALHIRMWRAFRYRLCRILSKLRKIFSRATFLIIYEAFVSWYLFVQVKYDHIFEQRIIIRYAFTLKSTLTLLFLYILRFWYIWQLYHNLLSDH